jgi:hypothetical protein
MRSERAEESPEARELGITFPVGRQQHQAESFLQSQTVTSGAPK